jgi:putative aldouronate transport system permease protein
MALGQGTSPVTEAPGVDLPLAPAERRRALAPPDRAPKRRPAWWLRFRRDRPLLLMVLPALLLLILFNYLPMFGLVTAFQYYNVYQGFLHSPWVGLRNFNQLFTDPAFWKSLWLTLELFAVQTVLFFPVPIALAIMLDRLLRKWLRNLLQAVAAIPHFFNWVLVITLFEQMLGGAGVLDTFLRNHGVNNPFDFMTDSSTFPLLVSAQAIWKEAGFSAIIFVAAIAGLNPELYEASAADGAGRWRQIWHVTLPGIMPLAVLLMILNLGSALSFGFQQMFLQLGAVGTGAAQVLSVYAYQYGIVQGQYSYGAAAGMFISVVSVVLLLGTNWLAHRFGQAGFYQSERSRRKMLAR